MYPMKLTPPLKDYLWGGTRLKTEYGKHTDLAKVAESWELACHRDGMSVIANGPATGQTLADFVAANPAALGTRAARFPYFPLLIKLIDAHDNLSVQVHPANDYALRVEGEYGKTEMWYVVDAEPGARLIYGFKQEITREEFAHRIADNTLLEVVNEVPVKRGDVFFIEAGTLHGIGAGILIAEIQQNSNTTYRVYDYGRLGADGRPRALHIAQAQEVTTLTPPTRGTCALARLPLAGQRLELLAACDYFTVYHGALDGRLALTVDDTSFQAITVLAGTLALTAPNATEERTLSIAKGETALLTASLGDYTITGSGEFILSMV